MSNEALLSHVSSGDQKGPAVLFLLSSLSVGGSEAKTIRIANALAGQSRAVIIAYLGPPETLLSTVISGVTTVHLHRKGKFSIRALLHLVKLIRQRDVRFVIAVNLYPALYSLLARLLAKRRPLRIMVSVNTTEFATQKEQQQMLLYRHVLRRMDTVIFGAAVQRDLWSERYGLARRNVMTRVLYNGVDTTEFCRNRVSPARPDGWPATRSIVVTTGALRSEKSHNIIVRAVASLQSRGIDIGAVIVGDGPERPLIEREIERLCVAQYVRLVGEVLDVRPHLAAADVFVLSSTSVETFSNAALEAMAIGCPIVSSQIGGMEEMLGFGGGVTYPAGDVSQLCNELADLIRDPARRARLGQEARQAAVDHFGLSKMVADFNSLIAESDDLGGLSNSPIK